MNIFKEHVTLELITILRPKICIISYFRSSFKVLGLSFNFLNVENGNILFYFLRNLLIDKKRYCHALHKLRGIVQGRCPTKHDSSKTGLMSSLILDFFNTFSRGLLIIKCGKLFQRSKTTFNSPGWCHVLCGSHYYPVLLKIKPLIKKIQNLEEKTF